MTKWHPATKLLVLAALLVLPYLLWTRGAEPTPEIAASVAPAGRTEPAPGSGEPPPAPFVLPPLELFTQVVERPLFSPTRRMPPPPAEPPAEVSQTEAPVVDRGPAEPELHFFGTMSQDGVATALVTFPGTGEVARLQPGDPVGDWEVASVERNRLELKLGDERRSFEIFGSGMRGARPPAPAPPAGALPEQPSPEQPSQEQPSQGAAEEDMYRGDELPGQQ